MKTFDFTFTLNETYPFWSGIIGGTFLMLSYFGTDQSQVQRYLTAKSVDEARSSLLISAYWKIPLQALILLIGILVFVFYLFQPQPTLFNPAPVSYTHLDVYKRQVLAGLNTYFEALNAAGGIGGKYKGKVLAEDITYANPSSGSQKYQKIKDQVTMFASIIGTDQINGVLPLLAEDSILALPTTFDAEWVRNPNLLPWGVPYQLQAINGVGYAVTDGGYAGKPVCTMTLATGYGEAVVEGIDHLAKEMNFTVAAKATFKQDDLSLIHI